MSFLTTQSRGFSPVVARGVRDVAAACLCLALTVGTATAQSSGSDAPAASTLSAAVETETVTVTAERRTESIDRLPLSITAFGAEELPVRGITTIQGLEWNAPNITFGGGTWSSQITIRGIGTENTSVGGDPGVGFYVDGVYLGQTSSALYGLFDVDRIEVLRGPQGTLYGRNSTGGAINLISKTPTNLLTAGGDILYGSYDRIRAEGAFNIPIVDGKVAARFSAFSDAHSGYTDNLFQAPHHIDDGDMQALRGQLLLTPTTDLDVLIRAYAELNRGTGPTPKVIGDFPGPFAVGVDPTTMQPIIVDPFKPALPNPDDPRKIRINSPQTQDQKANGGSIEANWRFQGMTLTSLTGLRNSALDDIADYDGSELDVLPLRFKTDAHQVSEELRLASGDPSKAEETRAWDWLLGLYYFHEHPYGFLHTNINIDFPVADGPGPLQIDGDVTTDSYAAFGQTTYHLTNWFAVTGGLRYTYDIKDGFSRTTFETFYPPPGYVDSDNPNADWNAVTGNVALEVTPDPSDPVDLLYFRFSRGFKSGGFNIGTVQDPYDPEYVYAYELGAKDSWLARRLHTSFSAFYEDYRDLQVFQVVNFQAQISNAAKASIYGTELEWRAKPMDDLQIDGNFAWLHATYEDFASADDSNPAVGVQDLSGNHLPRAPELATTIGLQYTVSLGHWGDLTPRAQTHWQAEQFFRQFNTARDRQTPYSKTDLRLIYESLDGHWDAQIFVMNVEDSDVIGNIFVAGSLVGSPYEAFYEPPRTYGFQVGYHM